MTLLFRAFAQKAPLAGGDSPAMLSESDSMGRSRC